MKKKLSLSVVCLVCLGVFGLASCDTENESTNSVAENSTSEVVDNSSVGTTSEVETSSVSEVTSTEVSSVETTSEETPVGSELLLTYDFSGCDVVASSDNQYNSMDDTSLKAQLDEINTEDSQAKLESTTGVSKVYVGYENYSFVNCLKMSSSKVNGEFTLNFSEDTKVNKVVVTGCGWYDENTKKEDLLAIGDAEDQTFTDADGWVDGDLSGYNFADYTYNITPTNTVAFTATKRVLITKIAIFIAK
ncbi:MAG: hypothetical protein WCR45_07565 [Bacteroidaceae bacterium]